MDSVHSSDVLAGLEEKEVYPPSTDARESSAMDTPSEKLQDREDSRRSNSADVDMSDEDSTGEAPMRKAGFSELFRFATKWDLFFNFAGLVAACVAGAAQVSLVVCWPWLRRMGT